MIKLNKILFDKKNRTQIVKWMTLNTDFTGKVVFRYYFDGFGRMCGNTTTNRNTLVYNTTNGLVYHDRLNVFDKATRHKFEKFLLSLDRKRKINEIT
jgi:hypothetical protein